MKDIIINILRIFTKLLKYALITVIGLFFISVILLSGTIRDFRAAYLSGLEGKNQLTEAFAQLKSGNYEEALRNSQLANLNFNAPLERLNSVQNNIFVKKISLFRTQVNYLEYLFKTTEILSSSLERSIPLVKQLEEISGGKVGNSFANLDNQNKSKFLQLLYESGPEINGLKANLKLALFNIDKIHKISILWPVYGQISEYKTQLQEVSFLLEKISSLIQVLPTLSGYPVEKEFLILLQNNDELRPTGGFIGVFGLAHVKNGNIISLKTSDSYHLDMPAVNKWQKEPPAPLKKYLEVENWYLRDANWVPDWPLAAQKINEIYTGESLAIGQAAPNFAGIIAVNPDFVGGLLNLVGPIKASGEEYNAHNFQELLQYNVEVAYKDRDISSWDRKEIINELLEELKTRLFNLSSNQWVDLAKVITEAIERKDLQMYFFDSTLEELVKNIGAAGEMKQTDSDYLMVVDANLAAFKSDAVVKKKIDYNLSQRNNKTTATLTLNYRHEGDFDWRTTRYRSYTRVYLPYGSRLITSSGLDKNKADWSSTDDQLLNKTVFAFFFTVEPGTEKEISLSYSLPESINQQMTAGTYNLLVQKQSGRRTQELTVTISPEKGGVKNWVTDLWTDKFFQ
jgi:hypothetical protein